MVFILSWSCNHNKESENNDNLKNEEFSGFNLKTDYTDLINKMTKQDTIKIYANTSSCQWVCFERILLTRNQDSLSIWLRVSQMYDPEVSEIIKISKNDTIWRFNEFLINNKDRVLMTDERERIVMSISHGDDTLNFYAGRLGDLNRFIEQYYETMFKLKPTNKAYKFMTEVENGVE